MAVIRNTKSNTLVSGTSGDDTIQNGGYWDENGSWTLHFGASNVTIECGSGNDSVYNLFGNSLKISGGDGDDTIHNDQGDSVTIEVGTGNDSVYNQWGNSAKINLGDGNDYIYNHIGNSVTIDCGSGNDYVNNDYGKRTNVSLGIGNDSIESSGFNSTIIGGKDNDAISLVASSHLIKYSKGDGNDTIYGFNESDTLKITGSQYSTTTSGNDVIITVGDGKILLVGAKGKDLNINKTGTPTLITLTEDDDDFRNDITNVTIDGGTGNDTVWNYGNSAKISGGDGKDSIHNHESDLVTIDGGTGNDYACNYQGDSVKISLGDGDDSIYNNSGDSVTIAGGAGNDSVLNYGINTQICGGNGNDSVFNACYLSDGSVHYFIDSLGYGKNVLFKYTSGDGDDIIYGFKADSTLQIGDGTGTYSTVKSNEDIIVTVGEGKITLSGAASLSAVNIDGEKGSSTALTFTNTDAAKQTLSAQIITADATARTKAVKITGNVLDNTILGGSGKDTLYGADGNDSIYGGAGNDKLYGQNGNDTLWGGTGNDTLKGGDGDDLFIYSSGKDVISDYAAGDKISIGAAISKTSVKGADATFTIGKNTLTVKNGKGKEIVFIDANGKERTVIGGAWLADNSSSSKATLAAWREVGDASARTKAIKLTGNALNNTILGGSGKDTLYGADGNDYLVGNAGNDKLYGQNGDDTLWGGKGNDSLWGGDGADTFIYAKGDGNDVIYGFDENDILQITGDFTASYNFSNNSIVFNVGSGSVTLKDFTTSSFKVNNETYVLGISKK